MKSLIGIIFLLSAPAFAVIDNCTETAAPDFGNMKGLSVPNCARRENLFDNKLCGECKQAFEVFSGPIIEKKEIIQAEFFQASLDEYKKNLISSMMLAVKSRAMQSNQASFSKSATASKMKEQRDFLEDCKSSTGKEFIRNSKFFESLTQTMGNDLAKMLASSPVEIEPTLLKRGKLGCFIPEKDILLATNSALEDALDVSVIEKLSSLNPQDFSDISEMFESIEGVDNFAVGFQSHPILKYKTETPAKFISFLKSIKRPATATNLRQALYSNDNSSHLDNTLAESCNNSYKSLVKAVCGEAFDKGRISLNHADNIQKLPSAIMSEEDVITSMDLFKQNERLLQVCVNPPERELSLEAVTQEIGNSIEGIYRPLSLEEYRKEEFDAEVGNTTEKICSRLPQERCTENTWECLIYNKYKSITTPGTVENKLATSSQEGMNKVLRSMLGDRTSTIDPKAREVLVLNGILPKDDGTTIQQPVIRERDLENIVNQTPASTTTPVKVATKGTTRTDRHTSSQATGPVQGSSGNNYVSQQRIPASAVQVPKLDDILGNNDEIKSIQDEIRRRLGAMDNRPVSREQAKTVARESFRARSRTLTPSQAETIASRMMAPPPSDRRTSFADNAGSEAPSTSSGPSHNERWRQEKHTEALMGMAGAQKALAASSGRSPASENENQKPKDLTKVALNIPEEQQVTLSEIFNEKIFRNDPETQLIKVLLRSNNNFLLQVKGLNFKVVFLNQNKFSILLESGDKAEAERLRPQLELF